MAREKWLVDPAQLDKFQRDILTISVNDSCLVKGCAGSGKTILALYRANDIYQQAKAAGKSASFTMIIYTRALQSFIQSGIKELGIGPRQVIYAKKWDGSLVDHIIIDEAQDFTKTEIDEFLAASNVSIMLYGDTQQQIYDGRMSTEAIATHLKLPSIELLKNYRLPKLIAAFASHIGMDKELENKCVKTGFEKPKLKKFNHWQEEIDFIFKEIETRNHTDVAILLPFNDKTGGPYNNFHRNIQSVREHLDNHGYRYEYKINDSLVLDFDSELPKLITFHSSKGLQFETVFIPFFDYPGHDRWFIGNYQMPLYVALTRTYRNLYLTYTERLTPFFYGVPLSKYELIP